MGRMTYDGLAGTTITYNRLGLPAKISGPGGSVLAKYAYLSDGMKTGAFHAGGRHQPQSHRPSSCAVIGILRFAQ